MPLIKDTDLEWQTWTHTTFCKGDHTVSTPRWQYIVRYHNFKALVPADGSPM